MQKATIRDVDVQDKRVLVRVDFNVPLDEDGQVTDDTRIRAALPTITYLLEHGAAVILMSHLGRPDGKRVEKLSLKPVYDALQKYLVRSQLMSWVWSWPRIASARQPKRWPRRPDQARCCCWKICASTKKRSRTILTLPGNSPAWAMSTSTTPLAQRTVPTPPLKALRMILPGYAGFLMEKELDYLGSALEHPRRPFVAIVGGAKISDKIAVLDRLLRLADAVLIGGAMANTFLKAKGFEVGDSLVEDEKLDEARRVMADAQRLGKRLVLPVDVVIAEAFAADAAKKIVAADHVPAGWRILDIGPQTVESFEASLADAQTIVFNGTMGVAEFPAFATGTNSVIVALVEATARGATTIIGGGDSAAAVEAAGAADKVSHVSTGGGASLEFLEGRTLPGVAALQDKK